MKKLSIFCVMLLLVMTFLPGCAYRNKNTTKKEKMTIWCWDEKFNVYAIRQAVKMYEKSNPNVDIKVENIEWAEIQTKLAAAAESENMNGLPDIVLVQDNAFQKALIRYPALLADITDSGIDFSKFSEGKIAYSVLNGKNYGVPFDNGTAVGCYRTDILQQAGYSLEDMTDITWEEFIKIGKDVLNKTGYALCSCEAGEPDLITMMLQSAGESLFDEEGRPMIANNKTLKKAIKTYVNMVHEGVLQLTDDSWNEYIKSFSTGTVAGAVNGCWIMASIQANEDQAGNWGVTNIPRLSHTENATNYSNNGGSTWAILSNSKHKERAEDFLKNTVAGSVDFYSSILLTTGIIANWGPAVNADVYSEPSKFYGGDAVYAKIIDYTGKVPSNATGVYYYEARDAVAVMINNILNGAGIEEEMDNAQMTMDSYGK